MLEFRTHFLRTHPVHTFRRYERKKYRYLEKKTRLDCRKGGYGKLFVTHPDYMNFCGKRGSEEYPASYYEEFLQHIASKYKGQFWHVFSPMEIAKLLAQIIIM